MTETGWPLIPREVLPAPITPAKRGPMPRAAHPADPSRQLPFFGAETTEPSPADLAGLLAGPGRLGRMGGTARVSVVVDAAWRVHVLIPELVSRGLVVNWHEVPGEPGAPAPAPDVHELESVMPDEPDPDIAGDFDPDFSVAKEAETPAATEAPAAEGGDETEPPAPRFEVVTAYSRRLNGLAAAWPEAAAQLFLSGPRLRLWVAAAGEPVPGGYALGLDPGKDPGVIDAALVRAGLAGRLPEGGRRYLIMGKRRVARLAELVGDRPAAAPEQMWPGGAGA